VVTTSVSLGAQWHDLHVNFGHGSEAWRLSTDNLPVSWLDVPMTLRFGDFNLDGYPDALAVLKSSRYGRCMF